MAFKAIGTESADDAFLQIDVGHVGEFDNLSIRNHFIGNFPSALEAKATSRNEGGNTFDGNDPFDVKKNQESESIFQCLLIEELNAIFHDFFRYKTFLWNVPTTWFCCSNSRFFHPEKEILIICELVTFQDTNARLRIVFVHRFFLLRFYYSTINNLR